MRRITDKDLGVGIVKSAAGKWKFLSTARNSKEDQFCDDLQKARCEYTKNSSELQKDKILNNKSNELRALNSLIGDLHNGIESNTIAVVHGQNPLFADHRLFGSMLQNLVNSGDQARLKLTVEAFVLKLFCMEEQNTFPGDWRNGGEGCLNSKMEALGKVSPEKKDINISALFLVLKDCRSLDLFINFVMIKNIGKKKK